MEKTSTCPKCNYVSTDEEFSLCPKCGIIIKKYYERLETRQKLEAERLESGKKAEEDAKLKTQQKEKKSGVIILIQILLLLLTGIIAFWYYNYYQPSKVAEEYLKAIQLQDIDKMYKIGLLAAGKSEGILINLLNWNFIDEKRTDHRKEMLDLTEERFKRLVNLDLETYKVDSVDKLPYEWLKEEYKSYEIWRSSQIKRRNAFEENNVFYYYDNTQQVEFLLDIAFTNKLGMELKKKYILIVEQDASFRIFGSWKVIKFTER